MPSRVKGKIEELASAAPMMPAEYLTAEALGALWEAIVLPAPVGGPHVPGGPHGLLVACGTDPDTYDADHGRAMDMAVRRYTELYGEAPATTDWQAWAT
ncbi:MAG: hypothetical protein ACREWE_09235 [Gammaproteobacteria bacterium]